MPMAGRNIACEIYPQCCSWAQESLSHKFWNNYLLSKPGVNFMSGSKNVDITRLVRTREVMGFKRLDSRTMRSGHMPLLNGKVFLRSATYSSMEFGQVYRKQTRPFFRNSMPAEKSYGQIMAEPSDVRKKIKAINIEPDYRLSCIRELFKNNGITAYIVPSVDPHQSEFIAEYYMRRPYISGFTGSAGTAVITLEEAALWTDGRYYLQAESQLGPEWKLMRAGTPGVPPYSEWLRDTLPPGSSVGIDPFLFTCDEAEDLRRTLDSKGVRLILLHDNLVDKVWGTLRPDPPCASMRVHDIKYAGITVLAKLDKVRNELLAAGATAIIVSMLDEVAWLFNLRGGDVKHSPVTYAYAIVELDSTTLFVDLAKVTEEVKEHLKDANVFVKPYGILLSEIERLASSGAMLWLDSSKVSAAVSNTFSNACSLYYDSVEGKKSAKEAETFTEEVKGPGTICRGSPITLMKAVKNEAELNGMRQAHLRDAAALAEFWAWLERTIIHEKKTLSEVEVGECVDKFRSKQSGFVDTSFDTICGSGANGAIVHYRAEPGTSSYVVEDKLLLLDSGGLYIDGTTDITRTVHFGIPTAYQKECFTRVLKGHIALDQAVFPDQTPGFVLDILARSALWQIGLDYRHGTGHGVGAALNVHEGPQGISPRYGNTTGMSPGMIISNEPGYYEDHSFGIRIENLLHVCEVETPNHFGGTTFLGFERLTFVPIQTKLIEMSLLSDVELKWINEYHEQVWNKNMPQLDVATAAVDIISGNLKEERGQVSPLLHGDALEWLRQNTVKIQRRKELDNVQKS